MTETFKCGTCGFTWEKLQSNDHNCAHVLKNRACELRAENARLVARLAELNELSAKHVIASTELREGLERELADELAKNEKLRKRLKSHESALLSELEARIENAESALAAEMEKVAKLEVFVEASGNVLAEWGKKLQESEAGAADLREALERHHNWHAWQTDRTPVYFGDTIGQVDADEYAECEICEVTVKAISSTAGASLLARIAELESLVAGLEQDRERLLTALTGLADWSESHFEICDCRGEDQFTCRKCELTSAAREAINQARPTDAAEIERRKA